MSIIIDRPTPTHAAVTVTDSSEIDFTLTGQDITAVVATSFKSGSDTTLITGTAGTSGNLTQWNADGDLVDAGIAVSALQPFLLMGG